MKTMFEQHHEFQDSNTHLIIQAGTDTISRTYFHGGAIESQPFRLSREDGNLLPQTILSVTLDDMISVINVVTADDKSQFADGTIQPNLITKTNTLLLHMGVHTDRGYDNLGIGSALSTLVTELGLHYFHSIDSSQYPHVAIVAEDNARDSGYQSLTGWTSRAVVKQKEFTNSDQIKSIIKYGVGASKVFVRLLK